MFTRANPKEVHSKASRLLAAGIAATAGISMAGLTPVAASTEAEPSAGVSHADAAEALENVDDLDEGLILDPLEEEAGTTEQNIQFNGENDVDAGNAADVAEMTTSNGSSITVTPPETGHSGGPEVQDPGTVTFAGDDFANSIVETQRATQMLSIIPHDEAPSSYAYDVNLEAGYELSLEDGLPVVTDADGNVETYAGEAWAVDAEGNEVPTYYEIEGSTLTQVVDHAGVDEGAYPVVADPVWFSPAIVRCLMGLGLTGPEITRIASSGAPGSMTGALGRAAMACIRGR